MMFLKGLHWYEWLLIGTVVTVLGVAAIILNKYEKQLVLSGAQATENKTLSATVRYQNESATITDIVVTEFVQEKIDEKVTLDKSREGVINDYLSMAGKNEVEAIPQTVVKVKPQKNEIRATKPETDPIGDIYRLSILADRLHEHYCLAAPLSGVGCDTNSVTK